MTSRPLTRRSKAVALVPLALLSGVWTASLVSTSANASNASDKVGALPDGTSVPTDAIEAPASVPVPGVIAPAVPEGSADSVVSGASSNGIPAPALSAYQRGAQIINAADKSCNIPWELIAAIGRVESDHGRYNGNTLTESGVSKPGIFGIALNGKNGTQAIQDTDGGQLDEDKVFDRAVGPMQFIPSTWQVVKVDADGDDKRNPQDMDDAALATAVYLCSGKDNLSNRKGQEAAVYRYNHSQDYVNLVLRIMEAYSNGDYTAVPSGAAGASSFSSSSSYSTAIDNSYKAAKVRKAKQAKAAKQRRLRSPTAPRAPAAAARLRPAPAPASPAPAAARAARHRQRLQPGRRRRQGCRRRRRRARSANVTESRRWRASSGGGTCDPDAPSPRPLGCRGQGACASASAADSEPTPASQPASQLSRTSIETPGPQDRGFVVILKQSDDHRYAMTPGDVIDRRPGSQFDDVRRARSRLAVLAEHPRGVHRPVAEDDVGAGAVDRGEDLEHRGVAVDPALGGGGLDHGVLAGDVVRRHRDVHRSRGRRRSRRGRTAPA